VSTEKDAQLQACLDYLKEQGASDIYLFGTWAEGEASDSSDLDLAIRGIPGREEARIKNDLRRIAGFPVDIVLLDEPSPFATHVQMKIDRGWAKRA
jgi:predicted nucleotidyltransferase